MRKENFIKTTDSKTKDKLLILGFQMIDESNDCWTFLNCGNSSLLFESDNKNLVYTNIMCM